MFLKCVYAIAGLHMLRVWDTDAAGRVPRDQPGEPLAARRIEIAHQPAGFIEGIERVQVQTEPQKGEEGVRS